MRKTSYSINLRGKIAVSCSHFREAYSYLQNRSTMMDGVAMMSLNLSGYFTLIGDKAPPAAHDSSAATRVLLSSHRKRQAQLVFKQMPILVGRIFHIGYSLGCCPVRATGGFNAKGLLEGDPCEHQPLLGSVVRTLGGGEELSMMRYLVALSL